MRSSILIFESGMYGEEYGMGGDTKWDNNNGNDDFMNGLDFGNGMSKNNATRNSWDQSMSQRNNYNNNSNNQNSSRGWNGGDLEDENMSNNLMQWKRQRLRDGKLLERNNVRVSRLKESVHRAETKRGRSGFDLNSIFRKYDREHLGNVDKRLFTRVLQKYGLQLTRSDVNTIQRVFTVRNQLQSNNGGAMGMSNNGMNSSSSAMEMGLSASIDFGRNSNSNNRGMLNQISYVRFLSVASIRYANAIINGQMDPSGAMRLNGDAVRERIRRVLRASSNQGMNLRKAFELFDKDGDGLVSASELKKASSLLGVILSEAEVRAMCKYLDKNNENNGKIEYEELFHFAQDGSTRIEIHLDDVEDKIRDAVHKIATSKSYSGDNQFNMRKAFASFDTNGDGAVSRKEFRVALKKMKITLTPHEHNALARRYDRSGSGNIDYEDFVQRVKYTSADLDTIAEKLRRRVLEQAKRGVSHWELFRKLDENGDGLVSKKEFRNCMKNMDLLLSEGETRALMRKFGGGGKTIKYQGEYIYKRTL